ncbi:hypothetical protein AC579_6827 [Pseudocercospora musae]|uniref:Uncharacterized protein n=1 Tax=Pseudocercospora musae TaxID=113226 RepID=A0A139IQ56_9PEZI|nr:hypothetical protein AC579_6827 [Pseudocercospora musae]
MAKVHQQIKVRRDTMFDDDLPSAYSTIASSASSRGYSPKQRPAVIVHKPSGINPDDDPRSTDIMNEKIRR